MLLRVYPKTFVSLVLVFAITVSSILIAPQVVAAPDSPNAPHPAVDLSTRPDPYQNVPVEVQEVVAFRQSLTAEQINALKDIIASYQPELNQLQQELLVSVGTTDVVQAVAKIFLPMIQAGSDDQQVSVPDVEFSVEKALALQTLAERTLAVQTKINAEVSKILTAEQRVIFDKNAEKLQSLGKAVVHQLGNLVTEPKVAEEAAYDSDCYYCAYYAGLMNYYAYYTYVYAYYSYINCGGTYCYYSYYYAYYGFWSYARTGMLYAGGAFTDSYFGFGYDFHNFSATATSYLYEAYYYLYYAYYYGYYCWQSGCSYGYYAYVYGSYAYDYAYDGYYYGYYCD